MSDPDTSLTGSSGHIDGAEATSSADPDASIALTATTGFLNAHTLDDLWDVLVTYAAAIRADILSYHHQAPDFAPDHANVIVKAHGFPSGWIDKYIQSKRHQTDPIMNVFAGRVRPMRWSEIDNLVVLSAAQAEYLTDLRSWLKGDGFGFPVFGPSGRNAYIGIGRSSGPLDDFDIVATNRLHWVVQSFHIRWCELVLMHMPQNFSLNARELQILKSIAQGMSDEIICGVVSAQLDSVRQSIRSILKKMGVSDRPSAILRGIGAGLIDKDATISRMH